MHLQHMWPSKWQVTCSMLHAPVLPGRGGGQPPHHPCVFFLSRTHTALPAEQTASRTTTEHCSRRWYSTLWDAISSMKGVLVILRKQDLSSYAPGRQQAGSKEGKFLQKKFYFSVISERQVYFYTLRFSCFWSTLNVIKHPLLYELRKYYQQ